MKYDQQATVRDHVGAVPPLGLRVLVIDDSAVIRETLKEIIASDADLDLMGAVSDPFAAAKLIAGEVPDVIILDVEMPRMDGIPFLRKIMQQCPIPVLMCSSLALRDTETLFEALESGAVGILPKPDDGQFLTSAGNWVCEAIKEAAMADMKRLPAPVPHSRGGRLSGSPKLTADAMLAPPRPGKAMPSAAEAVVCIGASTGGTKALRVLLQSFPRDMPGTVVVQHMPENFTRAFANRLDEVCAVTVKEASHNDPIQRGQVLIAPGSKHMMVRRRGARYCVEVRDGPLVCRHRPSVDVLFRSAARYAGADAIGILMTGMGDDGAQGLLEMRQAGAHTVAEDESTCVVFGMPKEAIKLGAACAVRPLDRLLDEILQHCPRPERA